MKDLLASAAVFLLNGLVIFDAVANPLHALKPSNGSTLVVHHGRVYGEIDFNPALGIASLSSCTLDIAEKEAKERVLSDLSRRFPIQEVDFDTMLSIVTDCQDLQKGHDVDLPPTAPSRPVPAAADSSIKAAVYTEPEPRKKQPLSIWAMMKGIVPGTKWCGVNDIANDYHDLGKDFHLDKCCRAHDHCPIKIKPFTANFGIHNYSPYTKSHCACDNLFYECLKTAGDEKSLAVGNIFFNVFGLQCAQPVRKKICVRELPLPKADDQATTRAGTRQSRFMFSLFGSRTAKRENNCAEWAEDLNAPPSIKFVKPLKKF